MSEEINIITGDVRDKISNLQTTTDSLEDSITENITKNNQLDVIMKINEINENLSKLIEKYKTILMKNGATTMQSVELMSVTDEQIGDSLRKISSK